MQKTIRCVDTSYHGPETSDAWADFVPAIAAMVTAVDKQGKPNILPLIGWAVMSRFPFIIAIAVCHGQYTKNYFPRYTNKLLKEVPEFVLNIPHAGLRDAISICGKFSGDKVDKFTESGLTPQPSCVVRPPVIAECPINFECKVVQEVRVGSHDVYFGEIVAVHSAVKEMKIDEDLVLVDLRYDEHPGEKLAWRSLPWWLPGQG
jgi:flavin reductase (DIM6/NTAB) family NADH-FMN oxidoreductase RutF